MTYNPTEKPGQAFCAGCERLSAESRIHVGTIRDLQASAMQYLTYPHDGERQSLESAVKASLCIVPLEDDDPASTQLNPGENNE